MLLVVFSHNSVVFKMVSFVLVRGLETLEGLKTFFSVSQIIKNADMNEILKLNVSYLR